MSEDLSHVVPGVYRHFKGKLYEVYGVAEHSETGEKLVVYRALYGSRQLYVRPQDMFCSEVDRNKYPDADQRTRFVHLGNSETCQELGADDS